MKTTILRLLATVTIGASVIACFKQSEAFGQSYTITDLGLLPNGGNCLALGINNSGEVVGYCTVITNSLLYPITQHSFLYSGGVMTDLGKLEGDHSSAANGINDSGQIVGLSSVMSAGEYFLNGSHAYRYSLGVLTGLNTNGGSTSNCSAAYGINNSGQIVGLAMTESNTACAFLYSNGTMTDLGTLPGYNESSAWAINNNGQVVGSASTTNGAQHAFLYSDGTMTDLGTLPGYTNSYAVGINDHGEIVGSLAKTNEVGHAFLYSGKVLVDLNTAIPAMSNFTSAAATAINNHGQIAGCAISPNNHYHAILLTPLPRLTITLSDHNIILTWPTNFSDGFTVEFTPSLAPPVAWSSNFPLPVVINGQNTVTNALSGIQMFYRLSQ
jgi:probable HAF family extracellular repeat protein